MTCVQDLLRVGVKKIDPPKRVPSRSLEVSELYALEAFNVIESENDQ